ncbi:glycosyltransferase family 4 protein [Pantanalinema rosaneae CENA516]|uniref:glycosyltransferase family 4 protein n=1 Tax=Pantanalinema rosaneae TaxID=1620701 RepID=UPI003D6F3EA3
MSSSLLVNLATLSVQPTGLTTYTKNLFPHLRSLSPTLLVSSVFMESAAQVIDPQHCHEIPAEMTSDQGSQGHLKRLTWTQTQLPKLYRELQANLLFSPVPEAPLASDCRYIVTVHDLIPLRFPQRFSPLTSYHRHYVPRVLNQAEHILCNSVATAQDIQQFHQISAQKITPIPLGYDASNFRFLNLPTLNYFLYVGRLDPYKNVQRLIEAFAALPDRTDYELWLVGPNDRRYLPNLEQQIQALGLSDRVKFLDYVAYEQLPTVINQAIALVFPSLWEGFGLPVLEAMACGTPVIASNLSSIPEVTGDAALLIDPTDVAAMSQAMTTLAQDAGACAELRRAGLLRATQFSWDYTGQATIDVLRNYL